MPNPQKEFIRMVKIFDKLHSKNGCLWDKKQTHKTLIKYLKEETAEFIRAAKSKNFKGMKEELGDIDMLINGAGGNSPKATTGLEEITEEELDQLEKGFFGLELEGFQKVFDLNFTGTLLPTLVFTRDMVKRQKGVVLNISSMNAYKPLTKIPAYSAAKAGVINLTRSIAKTYGPEKIRCNCLCPGLTDTGMIDPYREDFDAMLANPETAAAIPLMRMGTPEEVADGIVFLATASYCTGSILVMDGGSTA